MDMPSKGREPRPNDNTGKRVRLFQSLLLPNKEHLASEFHFVRK